MNGQIVVFAGPSLPPATRLEHPRLTWMPPAATGDILTIVSQEPEAICLIDGYFDHRPAPWHKEILVALEAGVRCYGASSMGALRAAELHRYGMVGVGAIYRAYRDGYLTGDDEVALIHGPESLKWAPLSVPMVDIRATLLSLVRQRAMEAGLARKLRAIIHDIHYADRDWPAIFRACEAEGIAADLINLLQRNHVPLKQSDAEMCIDYVLADKGRAASLEPVPETSFLRDLRSELQLGQRPCQPA